MAFANEKSRQTKEEFLDWLTETKKWPDVAQKAEEFEWDELLSFDKGIRKEKFGAMKAR
ncbi:10188_t:CDS:1, partial [Paraglomus occultum]